MRLVFTFLVLLTVFGRPSQGQSGTTKDSMQLMSAIGAYLKNAYPGQLRVGDRTFVHAHPSPVGSRVKASPSPKVLSDSLLKTVATTAKASRGGLTAADQDCEGKHPDDPCALKTLKTFAEIGVPAISGDSATVQIYIAYRAPRPKLPMGREIRAATFVRAKEGGWRFVRSIVEVDF